MHSRFFPEFAKWISENKSYTAIIVSLDKAISGFDSLKKQVKTLAPTAYLVALAECAKIAELSSVEYVPNVHCYNAKGDLVDNKFERRV